MNDIVNLLKHNISAAFHPRQVTQDKSHNAHNVVPAGEIGREMKTKKILADGNIINLRWNIRSCMFYQSLHMFMIS